MNTTTQTDLPFRLRELSHLDTEIGRLLTDECRTLDERNGVLMARYMLGMRTIDLESGRCLSVKLKQRSAALSECQQLVCSLVRLRTDPALNAGERSGISDALAVARVRLEFIVQGPRELVALARQVDEADARENARRLAARIKDRESRHEAGESQGGDEAHWDGGRWASVTRWIVVVVGLVGIALAGAWADWMAR